MNEPMFGKSVKATSLRKGDWLAFSNPRFNCRVVSVRCGEESVLVKTDFGNGGEPAIHFYELDQRVYIA